MDEESIGYNNSGIKSPFLIDLICLKIFKVQQRSGNLLEKNNL